MDTRKKYSLWTLKEENYFKKEYFSQSTASLARKLDKSEHSLWRKAKELNLQKPSFVTKFLPKPDKWDMAGVYAIINTKTGKTYIGASHNIGDRVRQHIKFLSDNKHTLAGMQLDWNKNSATFRFAVVKFTDNYMELEGVLLKNPNLYNCKNLVLELPRVTDKLHSGFKKKYIIDESECFIWTGRMNGEYSCISIDGTEYPAHRISYLLEFGKYSKHLLVRHTCHNKLCVNPKHLLLGTDKNNCDDNKVSPRLNKYECNWDMVESIRRDWRSGAFTIRALSLRYGFNVQSICFNNTWYDENYIRPRFKPGGRRGSISTGPNYKKVSKALEIIASDVLAKQSRLFSIRKWVPAADGRWIDVTEW